jgi:hypothetical protein
VQVIAMEFDKHDPETFASNGIKYPCKWLRDSIYGHSCIAWFPEASVEKVYLNDLCQRCKFNKNKPATPSGIGEL